MYNNAANINGYLSDEENEYSDDPEPRESRVSFADDIDEVDEVDDESEEEIEEVERLPTTTRRERRDTMRKSKTAPVVNYTMLAPGESTHCPHVMKGGARKGEKCGKNKKPGSNRCSKHTTKASSISADGAVPASPVNTVAKRLPQEEIEDADMTWMILAPLRSSKLNIDTLEALLADPSNKRTFNDAFGSSAAALKKNYPKTYMTSLIGGSLLLDNSSILFN